MEVGNTALYWAAWNGHEVVNMLPNAKANVNVKDSDGWTALHCATVNRHEAVVKLPLEVKAAVNVKAGNG
jgi:ankyrin repeat protein